MRAIGVNTWVWTSPLTDANLPDLLGTSPTLGFDAVELPLENAGDLDPAAPATALARHRPGAVRRRRDGAGPRPGRHRPGRPSPPPRTTCAPASTWPRRSARRACAARSTPRPAGSGGWTPTSARAAYAEWRENLAPVVDHAAERGVADRHRAAQPLRDLAGQHRRPGARPRSAPLLGPTGSGWPWTPTTSTSRSARSADAVRARRRAPRAPAGLRQRPRRPGRRPDRLAGAARGAGRRRLRRPAEHRELHPRQRRRSPWPPRSGGRSPPHPTTWPATAWRSCAPCDGAAPAMSRHPSRPAARRGRHRLLLHGQGPLQRLAQRRRLLPRRARRSRQQVLVGRDAGRGEGGRRPATAGPRRPPTGGRSSSATTSTSSTSAPPATCTPRSRSPRSRPASTCWSRSRWPTRVAEAEAMVARGRSRRARAACASMVGFNYRRVPALALARELIADGPDRRRCGRCGRRTSRTGWPTHAAPMTWRLRKETAGSGALGDLGSHVVDQVHYLLGDAVAVGERPPAHVRHRARPGPTGPEPVTVDDAAWATLRDRGGAVRQRRGEPDGHRAQERPQPSRCTATAGRSSLRPRAPQRAARARRAGDARRPRGCWSPRRTTPTSTPGGRRATCSAGTTRSPPGRRLADRDRRRARARRRRSPTGSPCSGCWPRSRRVRQRSGVRVDVARRLSR